MDHDKDLTAALDVLRALRDALRDIRELCDDPAGSEKSETLEEGLARLLLAASAAIVKATGQGAE